MLPVLIYEPDEAIRATLLDSLSLPEKKLPSARVRVSTGSTDTMQRAIEAENGISLCIFGIPSGTVLACAELGNLAMQRNRYSYTMFCLHDARDLGELLENCMRPAGILTTPLNKRSLESCLTRIFEDYQGLTGDTASDDCLIIENGGAVYRVAYRQILYLEALDKLLCIHTDRQSITVRRSLSSLEKTLPESFVRCHRAYIVNSAYINEINYSSMTLTLRNGDAVPVSRGQRTELKRLLGQRKGGPS